MTKLQNKIIQYLRENGGTASSSELAHFVLKIQSPSKQLEQLLKTVLKNSKSVVQNNSGQWELVEDIATATEKMEFCLIVVLPERIGHWSLWQGIAYVLYDGKNWKKQTVLEFPQPQTLAQELTEQLENKPEMPLLVPGFGNQLSQLERFMRHINCTPGPVYSMLQLTQRIFPVDDIMTRENMCQKLGLDSYEFFEIGSYLTESMDQVQELVDHLGQAGINNYNKLAEFYRGTSLSVSFKNYNFDKTFLKTLPQGPGVYQMENANSDIIYIGKAKNLRQRVTSYFIQSKAGDTKLERIRRELYNLQIFPTGSELEALLSEQEKIELHEPPINKLINVHQRPHRKRNRFAQILILPTIEKDNFKLFLISPQNGFKVLNICSENYENTLIAKEIKKHFFAQAPIKKEPKKLELAMSWISQNSDNTNKIDMRKIASPEEAAEILKSQIANLVTEFDNIVQYA